MEDVSFFLSFFIHKCFVIIPTDFFFDRSRATTLRRVPNRRMTPIIITKPKFPNGFFFSSFRLKESQSLCIFRV
jgi:hypothetical protein